VVGDRLGGGDAAAPTGDDQPHLALDGAGPLQQRVDLPFQRAAVELELDRGAGAPEPLEMIGEGKGLAAIEADYLEGAVAAVEPIVLQSHRGLGGRGDLPVDAGQLFEALGHAGEATWSGCRGASRVWCGSGNGVPRPASI
jgi:hypothetical protein